MARVCELNEPRSETTAEYCINVISSAALPSVDEASVADWGLGVEERDIADGGPIIYKLLFSISLRASERALTTTNLIRC
jgi:hypothetical protein